MQKTKIDRPNCPVPDKANLHVTKRGNKQKCRNQKHWKRMDNFFGGKRRYTHKQNNHDEHIPDEIKAIICKKALTNLMEYGTILPGTVQSNFSKPKIKAYLVKRGA